MRFLVKDESWALVIKSDPITPQSGHGSHARPRSGSSHAAGVRTRCEYFATKRSRRTPKRSGRIRPHNYGSALASARPSERDRRSITLSRRRRGHGRPRSSEKPFSESHSGGRLYRRPRCSDVARDPEQEAGKAIQAPQRKHRCDRPQHRSQKTDVSIGRRHFVIHGEPPLVFPGASI